SRLPMVVHLLETDGAIVDQPAKPSAPRVTRHRQMLAGATARKTAGVRSIAALQCPCVQLRRSFDSMHFTQRRPSHFDARSVLLFTALVFGSAGALHAQTPANHKPQPGFGPG